MDKQRKQAVSDIVELLIKEQDNERANEYENQLLEMLEEQDRNEIADVLAGRKLPSLLSDTIAKRIFSADSHRERLAYLLKPPLKLRAVMRMRDSCSQRIPRRLFSTSPPN